MPNSELQNPQQNQPVQSLQTLPLSIRTLLNEATDATSLAVIYHDQASALFHAIEVLSEAPEHTQTIKQLCSIGSLLSDEASNAANCSHEAIANMEAKAVAL